MKKYFGHLLLIVVLLAVTTSAFAAFGTPYQDNDGQSIWLTITTTPSVDLGAGWFTWRFDIQNDENVDLDLFTAGFAVSENPAGSTSTGHYRNWKSSAGNGTGTIDADPNTLTVFEGDGSIKWDMNHLILAGNDNGLMDAGDGLAWFEYDTDLPFVSIADYQARDGIPTGDWTGKEAPSIPEPMSMVLGCMGLSSVIGFRRLRRKES